MSLIHVPELAAGGVNQIVWAPAVPGFTVTVCGVLEVCAEANGTWRLVRPTIIVIINKIGDTFLVSIKLRLSQTWVLVSKEIMNFASSLSGGLYV